MLDVFISARLLRWFREAAPKEQPVDSGDALIFRVARPARYFFGIGIFFAFALGVGAFLAPAIEWYVRLIYLILVPVLFLRWPWALKLTPDGVSKRSYLGITRTIPWMDVIALEFNRTTGVFTITSKFGPKIRCSAFMVSPARFYAEMYKRATGLGPMPTRDGLPSGSYLPAG